MRLKNAANGVSRSYFIDDGDHFASIFSPGLVGTVNTRRAQFTAYYDGRGTQIGLCIAAAKINNQVATLKYVAKSRKETHPERVPNTARGSA